MKLLALILSLGCFVCSAQAENMDRLPETNVAAESRLFIGPLPQTNVSAAKPTTIPEFPSLTLLTQKTFFSLGALSLLLLLATGTAKRFSGKRAKVATAHEISILSRKAVGSRQALILVSVGEQKFLLSQGAEQLQLISEIEDSNSFRQVFGESFEESNIESTARVVNGASK